MSWQIPRGDSTGDNDGAFAFWNASLPSKLPTSNITGGQDQTHVYVLYMRGVPNQKLYATLSSFGKLKSFIINPNKSRVYVQFENATSCAAAIRTKFLRIDGRKLSIIAAQSEEVEGIEAIRKTTLSHWMDDISKTRLPTILGSTPSRASRKHLQQTGALTQNSFYESSSGISAQNKERDSLGKLFEKYRASTDDEGIVTIDGMMSYFGDLGVNIETAEVLVPVEIIQAPAMGTMTKDGFVDGWIPNSADTISKQKAYLAGQIKQLSSDMTLFKRVYRHTFIFAKEKDQKALPKDTAVVYWDLLFKSPGRPWVTSSTNWIEMWIEFLGAKWSKSVNKDMWNQTFEFFLKTMEDETLGFWSEDGAWPGVIDDFVAYAKEKRGDVPDSMETD